MQLNTFLLVASGTCAVLGWIGITIWLLRRFKHGARHIRERTVAQDVESVGSSDTAMAELMDRYPDLPYPAVKWAELKLHQSEWDEAERRGESLRKRFPRSAEAYLVKVRAQIGRKELDAADVEVKAALARFPSNPWAAHVFIVIANHRKDWPEVCRRAALARRRFPDRFWAYTDEFHARKAMGELEAAGRILEQALRNPISADGRVSVNKLLAIAAQEAEDWPEAARRWHLTRERADTDADTYLGEAEALRHCGRDTEANVILEQAAFLFPRHPRIPAQLRASE